MSFITRSFKLIRFDANKITQSTENFKTTHFIKTLLIIVISCILLLILYNPALINTTNNNIEIFNTNETLLPVFNKTNVLDQNLNGSDFIIYNSKCRIPNINPFNDDVIKLYKKSDYVSCRKLRLLSYVEKNDENTEAILHINQTLVPSYSPGGISCCYSNITRAKKNSDNNVILSKCVNFQRNFTMPPKPVYVKCVNAKNKKEVYANVHFAITLNNRTKEKVNNFNKTSTPFSVLMIGVDSVSRLNMIRQLPLTKKYLEENNFLLLEAYNKMGDNTFPNLMAILTGRNNTSSYNNCDPTKQESLDKCNLIWKEYNERNYVTAYAEDTALISTFNYHKQGFLREPVDYYFRPMQIAAEKQMKNVVVDEMVYCAGPEASAERILNAAKDFTLTFKNTPNFGFFWMNSFSHNKLNAVSRMDKKLEEFFEIIQEDVFNNTIIIFLSDHGMRFGAVLKTYSGWLEERLPMIYIRIPEKFKEKYPDAYKNLKLNTKKLTNPYDIHMTLQDILNRADTAHAIKQSEGCDKCKSLFDEIEYERSCEDAAIDDHWCACSYYTPIDKNNATVQKAAEAAINNINNILEKSGVGKKCAKYTIKDVINSRISYTGPNWYRNNTYLLIVLNTVPSATFGSTIRLDNNINDSLTVESGISRLDSYGSHAHCMNNAYLKTLCYCH